MILAGLAERGLAEDTVVLVRERQRAAQRGRGLRARGVAAARTTPSSSTATDRCGAIKRDVYEGGIRVPMIARVPRASRASGGVAAPGTVVDTPVAVWDVPATFAELAGTVVPTARDSVSFVPAAAGADAAGHDHLYWQFPEDGFDEAVRFGQWKAVRHDRRGDRALPAQPGPLARPPTWPSRFPSVVRRAERLMAQAVR